MWAHGTKGETPSEYKRRYAQAKANGEAVQGTAKAKLGPKGLFRRLWLR